MEFPRIVISALRGGSGKTIISVGLIAAWRNRGSKIIPFKKGPDYIDAGWLALAAGRPCYNLDTFLIPKIQILQSFCTHTAKGDIAVIEGNRGLYDGIDLEGRTSTAALAKLLQAPVVLCVDCTKSTRTMAAVIDGCVRFDPDIRIQGIILNRVAGVRHERILRQTIEHHCGIPVVGAMPKLAQQSFPERHMGLVPTPEHQWTNAAVTAARSVAESYLNLDALLEIVKKAATLPDLTEIVTQTKPISRAGPNATEAGRDLLRPRIGIVRDSAFQFYYPENIEALTAAGAEVRFLSPLAEKDIASVEALYIGGGFPETHVRELSENVYFRQQLKARAEKGLPIYAECGGLMYLGEALVLDGISYPMAGVLPISFGFSKRPQGHGYTIVKVAKPNPYFEVGTEIRGHEFHYSHVLAWKGDDKDLAFDMQRGNGLINNKDGVCYKNVLATYTHIHALGTPSWAGAMVRNALNYRQTKKTGP